jgi:hypothetical protein
LTSYSLVKSNLNILVDTFVRVFLLRSFESPVRKEVFCDELSSQLKYTLALFKLSHSVVKVEIKVTMRVITTVITRADECVFGFCPIRFFFFEERLEVILWVRFVNLAVFVSFVITNIFFSKRASCFFVQLPRFFDDRDRDGERLGPILRHIFFCHFDLK